jgi:hypothetical protein
MRQKFVPEKEPATLVVKNIRRATWPTFSAEDKIRIVLEGLGARTASPTFAVARGFPEPLLPLVERLSQGLEEATG